MDSIPCTAGVRPSTAICTCGTCRHLETRPLPPDCSAHVRPGFCERSSVPRGAASEHPLRNSNSRRKANRPPCARTDCRYSGLMPGASVDAWEPGKGPPRSAAWEAMPTRCPAENDSVVWIDLTSPYRFDSASLVAAGSSRVRCRSPGWRAGIDSRRAGEDYARHETSHRWAWT